jgi:hypothetical protein
LETLLAQDELDKIRWRFALQVRCAEKKGSRAGLLARLAESQVRHAEIRVRRADEKSACDGGWVFQSCKAASLRARESFTIGGRIPPLQHYSKSIQLLVLQRVAKLLVGGAES